jgi:hypothetical protein
LTRDTALLIHGRRMVKDLHLDADEIASRAYLAAAISPLAWLFPETWWQG